MSRLRTLALLVLLAAGLFARSARAQNGASRNVRVFLDCVQFHCDEDYYRTEIGFVDYVRDRQDADVHILVTRQATGGGGREYTLTFIGEGAAGRDTLHYFSSQDATDDMTRQGLAHVLKLGLIRYVAATPAARRLTIGYEAPPAGGAVRAPTTDPWNYWVFRLRGHTFFEGESSSNSVYLSGSVTANRTTDRWKLNLGINGSYSEDNFDLDSVTTVSSSSKSYGAGLLAVRTLGAHWALAGGVSVSRSTYVNRALGVRLAPGIEYNFFPYGQSTRRLFTLRYLVGVNHYRYDEVTIFGKLRETVLDESLQASLEARQPWGSLEVSLEGGHYLDDFSKNRVELSSDVEIRLVKGLSLSFSGSVERVHDQRYLPSAGATTEEILLQRRALATNYRFFGSVGLSYSFGSIFNNVVNPRFGSGGAGGGILID